MAFEIAIFTDVSRDESVNHMDGFQFQSTSPGFTGSDMVAVQTELNFVPVPNWGAAHGGDDLSHPEQWSYAIREGRMYFTKSRALGLTNNGRPGNQLTEAAVTDRLDDLVPYSPAQIMSATAWTMARAPQSTSEPWMTPLQIDPAMEGAALETFVTENPWVASALPAFVTMLQRALREDGHRVFIHHRDASEVLRWIAVGSLLLDPATVSALTFRVFHATPWNGNFKVVGVHPDLLTITPPTGWQDSPSASWIDLEAQRVQKTELSLLATAKVRWVIDHGIYDAMGAIQLASLLEPLLGEEDAARAAAILSFDDGGPAGGEGWRIAHRTLTALATNGEGAIAESYETELLDVLVTHQPRSADDFAIAGSTVAALLDAGLHDMAIGVAAPTLEALAAAPEGTSAFAQTLAAATDSLTWHDVDAAAQTGRSWATALAGAPANDLSTLFGATSRLGVQLEASLMEPAAARLAAQWAQEPSLGNAREGWYVRDLVEQKVIDRVVHALEQNDLRQHQALLRGEWTPLGNARESALSSWTRAADLAALPVAERAQRLRGAAIALPAQCWRIVLGELTLPLDGTLWEAFIHSAGVADELAMSLEAALRSELTSARLAESEEGITTEWSPVFSAIIDEQARGTLPPQLASAAAMISNARTTFPRAIREIEHDNAPIMRQSTADARVWAMENLAETGRIVANARDMTAVHAISDVLGEVTRQALDAYLAASAARGAGKAACDAALDAYGFASGALQEHLGGAIRRVMALHRDIARAYKRDEDVAPLIAEIEERFDSDVTPGRFDPAAWFGRSRKGTPS